MKKIFVLTFIILNLFFCSCQKEKVNEFQDAQAYFESIAPEFSGEYEGFKWKIDQHRTMYLLGVGDMPKWTSESQATWNKYLSKIKGLEFLDGITGIDLEYFSTAHNIQTIVFPSTLNVIDITPLPHGVPLTSIEVKEGNEGYCSVDGVLFDKEQSCLIKYPENRKGDSYDIPNTVKEIGDFAFEGSFLKTINIPHSVVKIGKNAFSICYKLEEITIPDSVKVFSENVFSTCFELKKITLPETMTEIPNGFFELCSSLNDITLPDSIEKIGDNAFKDCILLESITLSDNIKSIGAKAFESTRLYETQRINGELYIGKHLIDAKNSGTLSIKDGTLSIAASAFEKSYALALHIPTSVRYIHERAFCTSDFNIIQSIDTGENEYYTALNGSLYTSDLKKLLKYIPQDENERSFTIPDNVEQIAYNAFSDGYMLKRVLMSENVKYFGKGNFESIDIYYKGDKKSFNQIKKPDYSFMVICSQDSLPIDNIKYLTVHFPEDFPTDSGAMPKLTNPKDFEWGEYLLFAATKSHYFDNVQEFSREYGIFSKDTSTVSEANTLYESYSGKFFTENEIIDAREFFDNGGYIDSNYDYQKPYENKEASVSHEENAENNTTTYILYLADCEVTVPNSFTLEQIIDSQYILFNVSIIIDETMKYAAYLYDIEAERLTKLEDYTFRPSISPDLKYLAYTNHQYTDFGGFDGGAEIKDGFYIKSLENGTTVFYENPIEAKFGTISWVDKSLLNVN